LSIVARPPDADRRSVLWDLDRLSDDRATRLTAVPGSAGVVRVEDGAGRLLASLHGEMGFAADLLLPAGDLLYIRTASGEARMQAKAGAAVGFDTLSFGKPSDRARGSLDDALQRGLFASGFGPFYYNGFVDQTPDFVPVTFEPRHASAIGAGDGITAVTGGSGEAPVPTPRLPVARLLLGLGGSTAIARDLDATAGLRL
jgi:hypothetical protein